MQKIIFKKILDFQHEMKELISIAVDESIHYKMETEGMRAVGRIMINGEYKGEKGKVEFHDPIDIDILAQYDKIIDKREFLVKVDDFDYSMMDGNLNLSIQASIFGVKDDDKRVVDANVLRQVQERDVQEIENLLREEVKENPILENEPIIEEKDEHSFFQVQDDEEEEDLGYYYLYVATASDSYSSIAKHYAIDEQILKDYNGNKEITNGTIIIIPYVV